MSERNDASGARVEDRRRFNPDGTPRETEPAESSGNGEEASATPETQPEETSAEETALRNDLDTARRRVNELATALQALERDKEDFKRRLVRERERMIDVEKGNVAQILLETMDELDLSLISMGDSPFAKGVRMIRDGILARLATMGVERVSLEGQPFDPNLAEAVDTEMAASPEDDQKVVQELRPAYRLKDRIIRAGRVKVARFVQPAEA